MVTAPPPTVSAPVLTPEARLARWCKPLPARRPVSRASSASSEDSVGAPGRSIGADEDMEVSGRYSDLECEAAGSLLNLSVREGLDERPFSFRFGNTACRALTWS